MSKKLYLDANAHIPINFKALDTYNKFHQSIASHGHPSALSAPGRQAKHEYEKAREKIAELIGAKSPHQIIFTNTCTQACEWGINILFNKLKNRDLYISPVEHNAVRSICQELCTKKSIKYNEIPIDYNGVIKEINSYAAICVYVQNEIGTIQPLENLKCKFIFSDLSQALGKITINVTDLNIDIGTFAAHKFGGYGSLGFIYWWIKDLKNLDELIK